MRISAATATAVSWQHRTSVTRGGSADGAGLGNRLSAQGMDPLARLADLTQAAAPKAAAPKAADGAQGATSQDAQTLDQDKNAQQAILATVEQLYGIRIASANLKIKASHAEGSSQSLQASTSQNANSSLTDYHAAYQAYEQTSLGVAGTVTTTDGRQFALTLDYQQRIDYRETLDYQSAQGGMPNGDAGAPPPQPGPAFAWAGQGWGGQQANPPPQPPEPPPQDTAITWITKAMKHLQEMAAQQAAQAPLLNMTA